MIYRFYDTSSLLLNINNLFNTPDKILISSITLQELENIKSSNRKDFETRFSAQQLLRLLNNNRDKFELIIFKEHFLNPIIDKNLEITNDMKILSCAIFCDGLYPDQVIFVTNDLALSSIANLFFGEDSIESIEFEEKEYLGYTDIKLNEEYMSTFYQNLHYNIGDNLVNTYLILRDMYGEVVDKLRWTGSEYVHISYDKFKSKYFGEIKPFKNDVYQSLALDSLQRNTITMLKGPAGSGKSYLAFGYLMHQLEYGRIDKIIIFVNPVATRGSARLGFYPGSKDDKLLDSQIGNFLTSKIGGRIEVERLIAEEKIILLPFSDIRGYDTTGLRAGIYITEAQNLDINLMKLALQRIGENSICIIDGDEKTQVDDMIYANQYNGMTRLSQVFRGHDFYGEIELKNIYRSKIAELAEEM